jgi:hypothetical protein
MIRIHRMFGITGLFVGLALSLLMGLPAQAANLSINDTVEGQISLDHDANWEFGVVSNGTPFGPFAPGTTTVLGESASFSGTWIVNSPGSPDPGSGVIYIVSPCNPNLVRAIITASWSTSGPATISISVQSSASGSNLGPLPAAFAGLGVTEPNGFIGIEGLFRDPTTAAAVSIPSNLTIQYGAAPDADADCDGVPDADDECPGTPSGAIVDASGCSVDQLCPCNNDWRNHGQYVNCVANAAEEFVALGLLTESQKDAVVSAAARSDCGQQ